MHLGSLLFSKERANDAIISELDKTTNSVLIQAYSFTSTANAKTLVNAHKRGVKVEVILDKNERTDKYSPADFFANLGIPVKIDDVHTY